MLVNFKMSKFLVNYLSFLTLMAASTAISSSAYNYTTFYYQQRVDHFGFVNQDTFPQRYLIADQYWNANDSGPIFFYTGNEGDIVMFAENTGFMWDIAPEFEALLVFAEHRYYGDSLPYGNSSYEDIKYLGYLTSEQALADFTELITSLKKNISSRVSAPVIAFGGSYGGMLAAWGRMKYPHIYQGAIAASAPILQFTDLTPCSSFNRLVTKSFKSASDLCAINIRKSWDALNKLSTTDDGRQWLSSKLHLCQLIETDEDISKLKDWLNNVYGNLAMINYPYEANFLEPLPAWPVKEACNFLNANYSSDEDLILALSNVTNFYNNYTGQNPCINIDEDASISLGTMGWDFQACTEMVMPICADGETDMFEPVPWNLTEYKENCFKKYNTSTQEYMAEMIYGGRNISSASNIVFSNGQLDPWSGGGVLESISDNLVAITIANGAHHLDLRAANPADPPSVIKARSIEKTYIKKWIDAFKPKYSSNDKLKNYSLANNKLNNKHAIQSTSKKQSLFKNVNFKKKP